MQPAPASASMEEKRFPLLVSREAPRMERQSPRVSKTHKSLGTRGARCMWSRCSSGWHCSAWREILADFQSKTLAQKLIADWKFKVPFSINRESVFALNWKAINIQNIKPTVCLLAKAPSSIWARNELFMLIMSRENDWVDCFHFSFFGLPLPLFRSPFINSCKSSKRESFLIDGDSNLLTVFLSTFRIPFVFSLWSSNLAQETDYRKNWKSFINETSFLSIPIHSVHYSMRLCFALFLKRCGCWRP